MKLSSRNANRSSSYSSATDPKVCDGLSSHSAVFCIELESSTVSCIDSESESSSNRSFRTTDDVMMRRVMSHELPKSPAFMDVEIEISKFPILSVIMYQFDDVTTCLALN